MQGRRRSRRSKIVFAAVSAVVIVMIIAMAVYFGTCYHSVDVDEYSADSDTVTVTETDSGRLSDGEDGEPDAGLSTPLLTVTYTVTDVTDGVLSLLIDNQSGYVFSFDKYITLEKEENGEWAEVPFLEDAEWEDIAYELDDLKQTTVKYDLYSYFGELEEGTYRLTLSDISVEFSLPFAAD